MEPRRRSSTPRARLAVLEHAERRTPPRWCGTSRRRSTGVRAGRLLHLDAGTRSRTISRQDRLLQRDLGGADDAERIAVALSGAPDMLAPYRQCLRLAERATNRLASADFRQLIDTIAEGGTPPRAESDARPTPLARAVSRVTLSRDGPGLVACPGMQWIPDDADLLGIWFERCDQVELDLRPGNDSGWYDWQTWALETLVSPGAGRGSPSSFARRVVPGLCSRTCSARRSR